MRVGATPGFDTDGSIVAPHCIPDFLRYSVLMLWGGRHERGSDFMRDGEICLAISLEITIRS